MPPEAVQQRLMIACVLYPVGIEIEVGFEVVPHFFKRKAIDETGFALVVTEDDGLHHPAKGQRSDRVGRVLERRWPEMAMGRGVAARIRVLMKALYGEVRHERAALLHAGRQ